jgi:hypothetical protein
LLSKKAITVKVNQDYYNNSTVMKRVYGSNTTFQLLLLMLLHTNGLVDAGQDLDITNNVFYSGTLASAQRSSANGFVGTFVYRAILSGVGIVLILCYYSNFNCNTSDDVIDPGLGRIAYYR